MSNYAVMVTAKKEIEKAMKHELKKGYHRIDQISSTERLTNRWTRPEKVVFNQQKRLLERAFYERSPEQQMSDVIRRLYQNGLTPEQWNSANAQERSMIFERARSLMSQEIKLSSGETGDAQRLSMKTGMSVAEATDPDYLTNHDAGSVYAELYQTLSRSEHSESMFPSGMQISERSAEMLANVEKSYEAAIQQNFEGIYNDFNKNAIGKNLILEHINAEKGTEKWLSSLRRIENECSPMENLRECNPNYNRGECWNVNCQRCVPTYELRARGYDVTAKPRYVLDHLSLCPFDVWENPEIHTTKGNGLAEIEDFLRKSGDGTRVQVTALWKYGQGGHTFVAEMKNGVIHFLDPQTGEADIRYSFDYVEPGSVQFCRIDNLKVSDRIVDCCEEVKRT